MRARNAIRDEFDAALESAGFGRQGAGWSLESPEALVVVCLQKSNYGASYFVNVGAWLKALGHNKNPSEHECHVRLRPSSLDAERERYWETEVFNLEAPSIGDTERGERVREFMVQIVVPFARKLGSLEGIRELAGRGELRHAAVRVGAQALVSPTPSRFHMSISALAVPGPRQLSVAPGGSQLEAICDDLQEAGLKFVVEGFREAWPVDVATDLLIVLEQLPTVEKQLLAGTRAALEFYEQGIERSLAITIQDDMATVALTGLTAAAAPREEVLPLRELLAQLATLRRDFGDLVARIYPGLELDPAARLAVGQA